MVQWQQDLGLKNAFIWSSLLLNGHSSRFTLSQVAFLSVTSEVYHNFMALFRFIIVFYVALRATAAINHNALKLQHSNVHRQRTFCWFTETEVFKRAAAAVTVNADRGHCITGAPLWDTGHLTEQKRGRLGQGWEVKGGDERIQQEENWGR